MSLAFSYDIIDTNDNKRREILIEKRLLALKNYYSPGLLLIVRKMLETNLCNRITFKEVENYLHPFSE